MAKKTVKTSIRVNPKGHYGYGFHKLASGYRLDIPYASVSVFTGGSFNKRTIRNSRSGVRFIYENNRKGKTRIAHNVA
jgi:hypothetical protein